MDIPRPVSTLLDGRGESPDNGSPAARELSIGHAISPASEERMISITITSDRFGNFGIKEFDLQSGNDQVDRATALWPPFANAKSVASCQTHGSLGSREKQPMPLTVHQSYRARCHAPNLTSVRHDLFACFANFAVAQSTASQAA